MAMLNNQMVNLFPFPLILEDVFIWFHVELRVCALVSCLVAGVTRPCIVKPFIATWQQVLLIGVVSSPMVYCLVYSPYREGATNVVGVSSSFKTGASWHEPWGPQEPRLSVVSNREKLVLNFVVLNLHPLGRYIYIVYIYITETVYHSALGRGGLRAWWEWCYFQTKSGWFRFRCFNSNKE